MPKVLKMNATFFLLQIRSLGEGTGAMRPAAI
jgi:hypothetical protein